MNEDQFMTAVIELAHYRQWMVTHFRPAATGRGWRTPVQGDPGFPDLVLARRGVVIFAELKVGKGRITKGQAAWLGEVGNAVPFYVWRPNDMDEIARVLM
jgi:hypothetical protein